MLESGEEKEDILFKMRCKLFHFLKAEEKYGGAMEWKEKGVGALASPPGPVPVHRPESIRSTELLCCAIQAM